MARRLPEFERTKHVTFSLYPSEINTFRYMALPFGSVGRAMQVAAEILYDMAQRGSLIDLDEEGPPADAVEGELKAPMSCDLLPRTATLIDWLADPKRYGSRYGVVSAAASWLTQAHQQEQKRAAVAARKTSQNRSKATKSAD